MKFNKKTKEHVNDIIKFIESLGGNKDHVAASGSIYCNLMPIKKIRIADHLSTKGKTDYLHIIVQKEGRKHKYICIFCRNIRLLSNVGQVKQWLQDIYFIFNVIYINGYQFESINDGKYENVKKDVITKDAKLAQNKKEIDKLNNIIYSKEQQIEKLKTKILTMTNYHNKWQEAESRANHLHKKVNILLEKINENKIKNL